MDFVLGLSLTQRKKDKLTKLAHFIPMIIDYSLENLAKIFISEIVRFSSKFWSKLHEALSTKLNFGTMQLGKILTVSELLTIIVISQASKWLLTKLCITINVELLFAG
ncbi:integrase [Gossypium australe]|uniref:Integrase n=1 Tax=Gossypium australe TaxID=47621 RepID=A0A5B6VQ90_9ROSI|nr:integrase [Gossypium australe]